MKMNQLLKRFILVCTLYGSASASLANAQGEDPYKVVQHTTEQVLVIIKEAKGYSAKDPKRFNTEVMSVMEKVIDFDDFARGVMGTYASGQRYNALASEEEKAAFRERVQRFSSTFKQGLIDTYASSLLNFDSEKVETLPPKKGDDLSTGSATVMQNIFNGSGKSYVVQYSMRRNKAGEWKLHNLIIEGINLGLTYRSQFSTSAEKYHGDIDKVIANWTVEPEVTDSIKAASTKTKATKTRSTKNGSTTKEATQ
jgi:phospholipid transport system substrate-binding protein